MPAPQDHVRSDHVRLQTILRIRWLAIAGQLIALAVAHWELGIDLNMGLIAPIMAVAIIVNLIPSAIAPETAPLSEKWALASILFDVVQLGALLMATGGLNNPFALLILAPVTVGATVLALRDALIVIIVALAMVVLMNQFHAPLLFRGEPLQIPALFRVGLGFALTIGLAFLGYYQRRVSSEIYEMESALEATRSALAREQRLTDLGGVVAAMAHELGTPLGTIKLTATELLDDLAGQGPLAEDAALIRDQASRCHEILHSMGQLGKSDLMLRHAPFEALVADAAAPHQNRGIAIDVTARGDGPQPVIARHPEILHGLRNLIQNAVDFAENRVEITLEWDEERLRATLRDDGPGFNPDMIGQLGNPYPNRRRAGTVYRRPGYEGMGLGLFIAKTLLSRTGAHLRFANAGAAGGAVVAITWPRDRIEPTRGADRKIRGQNAAISADRPES